ncbi:MAG: hypothetical protein A2845_06220 [Candidatus Lloydbacteria bacterium RIFCSPHIGHO2_01_FULL_49_22]|uniref:Uncharacterized protein n=1 Tax=Candidatus Lloydbacteria bacterium RIFCSPHIGHO2_01_FULL_49_22 TaxID=1798658 RepID=A0A1G2CW94_9BACT|nr:MAG: hypothetical protein A2845_06220 [Candidatus Lloydbacteria bacterium RIFCSPHIGHO2_01_FULL_49_22]
MKKNLKYAKFERKLSKGVIIEQRDQTKYICCVLIFFEPATYFPKSLCGLENLYFQATCSKILIFWVPNKFDKLVLLG